MVDNTMVDNMNINHYQQVQQQQMKRPSIDHSSTSMSTSSSTIFNINFNNNNRTFELEEVDFDPITNKRKCAVHALMPNGILISLSIVEDTTFVEIKDVIY